MKISSEPPAQAFFQWEILQEKCLVSVWKPRKKNLRKCGWEFPEGPKIKEKISLWDWHFHARLKLFNGNWRGNIGNQRILTGGPRHKVGDKKGLPFLDT